jgi:hypothetical protein
MFIYRIRVHFSKSKFRDYYGLDTKSSHLKSRWKNHIKESFKENSQTKLHKAMRKFGIENCEYSLIEDGFTEICKLALAEIRYISENNTFKKGLNSTKGGDGIGRHDLSKMSNDEILLIKRKLGEGFVEFNKRKWENTTIDERREMLTHWHTEEVVAKRTETLKDFYKTPEGVKNRKNKSELLKKRINDNKQEFNEHNKVNAKKGAAKHFATIIVETPRGLLINFKNYKDLFSRLGNHIKNVYFLEKAIKLTRTGENLNGFRIWRCRSETMKKRKHKNGRKIKLKVQFPNGDVKIYEDMQSFRDETGIIPSHAIKRTSMGLHSKNFRVWKLSIGDINEQSV